MYYKCSNLTLIAGTFSAKHSVLTFYVKKRTNTRNVEPILSRTFNNVLYIS